ncbi:MAG TPA: DUF58 domain-containing protein [Thermoplasmata archaeon]|nr:DUF58 domain-containing protein [Thermoplasmata archaeon]
MSAPEPERRLRWLPLTPLLLAGGTGLLLSAVLTLNPVPLFLALPLLLAPVAAAVSGPRRSPPVQVSLAVAGTGATVQFRGTVATATNEVDARDLIVQVDRPASLEGEAEPQGTATSKEIQLRARWTAPEPTITEIDPPTVVWRDPLGLVERETSFSAESLVLSRYPPEILRIGAVRLERTTLLPGETHSSRVGDSGEFHGIRLARPEDPPRQINWRASARAGHRLANEYDLDKTGDLLLLLDARPSVLGREVDEHLLSISRAAALGLSESFLSVKSRVAVGVFGEFLEIVPLSTGRTQRIRIETMLQRARLSPVAAPPERCAVAARRSFPTGLTTVVLSSLGGDPSEDVTPYLRRRGFPVVVLSPSPLPLLTRASPLEAKEDELARRIARLVRRERIARAWQEAPTIDWDDYWSLGHFVDFVRRPRVRRAG